MKHYSLDEITLGGVIDVKKAQQTGYVSYEENEQYVVAKQKNMRAWKQVKENYEAIEANFKNYIEGSIGQEVEILFLDTPSPYMEVDAVYQTVNEPRWKSFTTLGLEDSLTFQNKTFKGIASSDVHRQTISGLYRYAFADEIKQMEQDFFAAFPEYTSLVVDSKSAKYSSHTIEFPLELTIHDFEDEALFKELYMIYLERGLMDQSSWKNIFNNVGIVETNIYVNVILEDPTMIPTIEMSEALQTYFKSTEYPWIQTKKVLAFVSVHSNYRRLGEAYFAMIMAESAYGSQVTTDEIKRGLI